MGSFTEQYFTWLSLDATTEEFREEISTIIERPNNEWIVDKVNSELREHIEIYKGMLTGASEEEKQALDNEIDMLVLKLGILRNMLDEYDDNNNLADELEKEPGDVKVVFAKNLAGNIIAAKMFEDIKDYGDDKYDALLGLYERLKNGDTDFNSEKQRPLTSSAKLKGIYELKDFQIRLIYMREGEYTVVIGACVKKDDNALRYRSSLENMKKQSEKYRQQLRDGKLNMEEELRIADEFMNEFTSGYKRGV